MNGPFKSSSFPRDEDSIFNTDLGGGYSAIVQFIVPEGGLADVVFWHSKVKGPGGGGHHATGDDLGGFAGMERCEHALLERVVGLVGIGR
ncbi:LOW QUALITY PROTEIN: hypothetical protein ColTof4_04448 [Colletotrichum tofieldiae]|nr:LOW QUALITY PROTEIN: hypothetical protein ColTof4_04448 [Colletotrichum tofieldiae]